uniref:DsrE family protein n=1 Tax=Ningiella ruwaisensis TaxID=2364274 RepID=UPI0019D5EF7A|nr:DsrE family protein [Ningiella ruwaisensis]
MLIISTHAPYHSSFAMDAYEAALGATNVGLEVRFLFQGNGVFQLLSAQTPAGIQHKNMAKKLKALPLFDIEDIYVCSKSVALRFEAISGQNHAQNYTNEFFEKISISDELEAQIVNEQELNILMANASHILRF